MHRPVVIIGAGPAGLLLARMLKNRNIDCLVLENRNETFLRKLYRGGILESRIVDKLDNEGASENLKTKGIPLEYIDFNIGAEKIRIDLSNERNVPLIYDQQNIVFDLLASLKQDNVDIIWEAKGQRYEGLDSDQVRIVYTLDGGLYDVTCDYAVGCCGFRGISRRSIPANTRKEVKEELEFAWLEWHSEKIEELDSPIVGFGENGFAMALSTINGETRFYYQIKRGTEKDDLPPLEDIWKETMERLSTSFQPKEMNNRKLDYMRRFYTDSLRYKRLFIAGDSAHQVPRFGSKGLNMAFSDAMILADAFALHFNDNDSTGLDQYTQKALNVNLPILEKTSYWNALFHAKEKTENSQTIKEIVTALSDEQQQKSFINFLIGQV